MICIASSLCACLAFAGPLRPSAEAGPTGGAWPIRGAWLAGGGVTRAPSKAGRGAGHVAGARAPVRPNGLKGSRQLT